METAIAETRPDDAISFPHARENVTRLPERSPAERSIALAIFILSFLYLCVFRRATWIDLDEGIILQGAQRILDGQVLYRDFFSFFTPGSYYLLALAFRVFGDSYLVAHTLLALVGAGFSPITYLLSRRVCGRQASLLVTGLMTVTAVPLRFVVLHNWDSTLWTCLALYCVVRLLETSSSRWAFAAASFVSITGLFEQSKGAGLLLGLGLGFLIIALYGERPNVFNVRYLTIIAVGLAWPLVITLIYFASQHALGEMLRSWFWPLQHYSTANRVPYGHGSLTDEIRQNVFHTGSLGIRILKAMIFSSPLWVPVLPILGLAFFVRLSVRAFRGSCSQADWRYYVIIAGSISGLLVSVVIVRVDYLHFIFLQPIFFILLAWIIDGRDIRSRFFERAAPAIGLLFSVSLLIMALAVFFQAHAKNTYQTRRGPVSVQTRDTVIDYVQRQTSPGEKMLIYPYQPTYYYLTATNSPTSFEYYQAGMHTYAQLNEMVRELSLDPPRFVLYQPTFAEQVHIAWPNTQASALARDPMADYIMRKYQRCAVLTSASEWQFLFMARRDLTCPNN
jgi:hypothetical protein